MTDFENQFLKGLITAAWPLHLQFTFAVGLLLGYYFWSLFYYRTIDPLLRSYFGRLLGVRIVWVLRHSSSYQTMFEFGFGSMRYIRWTWGIEAERERTFSRDGAVSMLSLLIVNILSGLWPVALFFFVFLAKKALSYVVFLPTCIAIILLYSAFWSGRYQVKGMH